MNLKNYAFVVLTIVGFAACKKNGSNNPEQLSTGEDTKISLSLSVASSGTKTYAPEDGPTATADELDMNTVDIFIYDNVSPFALTHKQFKDTDNASPDFTTVDGARRLNDGIELDAKTGKKLIYVGVNLHADYVTQIKAKQGLTSLEEVFSTMQLYNGIFNNLNPAGMPMFSNVGAVAELGKNDLGGVPATNKVSLELTRMLAKITVDGTPAFNVKIEDVKLDDNNLMPVVGGSIDVSTMYYSLNQVNDKTYLKGDKVVGWEQTTAFFEKALAPNIFGTVNYAPENLEENDLAKLTYAVVKARFIPKVFEDADLFTYNPGTFFFTVTDKSNGSVKYYINSAQAGLDLAVNTLNKEFRLYKNGFCYYHIYLNPENDHKVIRNQYYQVKISNIRGIGKSSPSAAVLSGTPLSLYNPELINTIGVLTTAYDPKEAATNANIEATVTIVPWTFVPSELEL